MSTSEEIKVAVDAALQDPQTFAREMTERGFEVANYGDFKVGDTLYIRAITFHTIGTLRKIDGEKLTVGPAVYVRDTQSWFDSLQRGEVESSAFPEECLPVQIHRAAIVDCFRWPHKIESLLGR